MTMTGESEAEVQSLQVDVLVAGGGSAGCAAAIASAESGAYTILVERAGNVGGTLVWQLLEHSAGFHDVSGNRVTGWIGQRFIDRLAAYGGSPGHVRDDVGYTATRTPVNHVELALVEAVMLAESGVRLSLNSSVQGVEVEGGRIVAVSVVTPAGTLRVVPGAVVDATGDGVIASLAGARMQSDAAENRQPTSLLVKVGGIDFGPFQEYVAGHPDQFRSGSQLTPASGEHQNLWGFGDLLREGYEAGVLSWPRNEVHVAAWPSRREVVLNLSRVAWRADDPDGSGNFPALARQALETVNWVRRYLPGSSGAYLAAVADRVGVRESRRVLGRETVDREDVLTGRAWPDAIGLGAFPIDIHDASSATMAHTEPPARPYQIPLGCLESVDCNNLFLAGRLISSTHEANGSLRITATCFVTGEAAGVAAAMSADSGQVEIDKLQRVLRERGVLLEPLPPPQFP